MDFFVVVSDQKDNIGRKKPEGKAYYSGLSKYGFNYRKRER